MSQIPGMQTLANNPNGGAYLIEGSAGLIAGAGLGDLAVSGADAAGDWLLSPDAAPFLRYGLSSWTGSAASSVISNEYGADTASHSFSILEGGPRSNPYWTTARTTFKYSMMPEPAN
jgi:hypothetical protein